MTPPTWRPASPTTPLFSLFPLLLGLIALLSVFLGTNNFEARLVEFTTGYLPGFGGPDSQQ